MVRFKIPQYNKLLLDIVNDFIAITMLSGVMSSLETLSRCEDTSIWHEVLMTVKRQTARING